MQGKLDPTKWDNLILESSPCQTKQTTQTKALADAYKNQGNDAYKSCRFPLAMAFYDKAIQVYTDKSSPVDPVLYTNRALTHLKLYQFQEALKDCEAALLLDSKNIKAKWRKIEALRGLKQFQSALEECNSLNDIDDPALLQDVSKMNKQIELEMKQEKEISIRKSHEEKLDQMMDSNGSKLFMEQILLALEKGLDEHKSEKSQNLGMTCSVLLNLLESQAVVTGIFSFLVFNVKRCF